MSVGNHKNTIEINGKRYDIATGKPVVESSAVQHAPVSKTKSSPRAIDGFINNAKNGAKSTPAHTVIKPAKTVPIQQAPPSTAPKKTAASRHPAVPASSRKPQRAQTLARHVVSRPKHEPTNHQTSSPTVSTRGSHIKPDRLKRAQSTTKSPTIARFPQSSATSSVNHKPEHHITKKHEPLPVKPAPAHEHAPKKSQHKASSKPVSQSEQQFTAAMHRSNNHTAIKTHKPPRHKLAQKLGVSRKTLHASAGVLTILLLVGFFAYQNIPNFSMHLASSRAGFSARLPSYQPSGFSMNGPIEYGPGQVTINFRSNTDERQFSVSQQVSNWNSEALVDNYLEDNQLSYQSYSEKGKTIYIYNDTSATWVSDGIWYQIDGDSSLTSDQLVRMASSL